MSIIIKNASCGYTKEPLKGAFGFKGSALTSLWQTAVYLESDNNKAIGLGVQSVLWSDADVYALLGEDTGNRAMFSLTQYAVDKVKGMSFNNPAEVVDYLYPMLYEYAVEITKNTNLRTTFVLNALVPLDFALWQLWAKENCVKSFDEINKFEGYKQSMLANIPLITYKTPITEVLDMAEEGTPLFKIKIGSNPNMNDNLDEMLLWDENRILEIHNAVKDIKNEYTENGDILYYLDANGRYDSKERLKKLISFLKDNCILDRVVLLEEPFDENNKIDVSDLPVCIAADESAHSLKDVEERFNLGYKALTLKPIAKTLSMTMRMAEYAIKKGMTCFCADLTVNPTMVSWNQCVAARLKTISKMKIGVLESNGSQNYINWEKMMKMHPSSDKSFIRCNDGVFVLDKEFYELSGGVFSFPENYLDIAIKGDA